LNFSKETGDQFCTTFLTLFVYIFLPQPELKNIFIHWYVGRSLGSNHHCAATEHHQMVITWLRILPIMPPKPEHTSRSLNASTDFSHRK